MFDDIFDQNHAAPPSTTDPNEQAKRDLMDLMKGQSFGAGGSPTATMPAAGGVESDDQFFRRMGGLGGAPAAADIFSGAALPGMQMPRTMTDTRSGREVPYIPMTGNAATAEAAPRALSEMLSFGGSPHKYSPQGVWNSVMGAAGGSPSLGVQSALTSAFPSLSNRASNPAAYQGVGGGVGAPAPAPAFRANAGGVPDTPVPVGDAARAIATGLNPNAFFGMAPAALGYTTQQARPKIMDGFHGADGLGPMTDAPAYGPSIQAAPGAGWGTNAHPSDYEYTARAGQAAVPRQWTEADLDPTVALGVNGFKFSPDTQGYTRQSPEMPLFRADMNNRSQAAAYAQQAAMQMRDQMFGGQQKQLDREYELKRADIAAGRGDHDKLLALAFNPQTPPTVRNAAIEESVRKGVISKGTADENMLDMVMGAAASKGDVGSVPYMQTVAQMFDPQRMSKAALIAKLQKAGADPTALGKMRDGLKGWGIRDLSPGERSVKNLVDSILADGPK